jgi:tetratricopeptide (TPR) repeat protein
MTLHRAGELAEAGRRYEAILADHPQHFDALRLLSVICLQTRDWARAAEIGRKAVAANPGSAIAHHNLANAYAELGQWPQALDEAERSVALDPNFAPAQARRGVALQTLGRPEAALAAFDAALALRPDAADAHLGRGVALRTLGRAGEAVASYDAALALRPDYLEAHNNRGNALMELERVDEALAAFETALTLQPRSANAHSNRGNALLNLDRPQDALAAFDTAIALDPTLAVAHYNRGMALAALRRQGEAVASFEAAIGLRPGDALYQSNYGLALALAGRPDAALAAFDAALAIAPDFADAHWNRGVRLLTLGRFAEGWAEYGHRWRVPAFLATSVGRMTPLLRARMVPDLRRDDLRGRRVLVVDEQGVGDVLMFASTIPDLQAHAGHVTLVCEQRLERLFATSFPGVTIVAPAGAERAADDAEVVVPIGDLARLYRNRLEDFPGAPYLSARAEVRERWAERLGPKTAALRVGLSWRGGTAATGGEDRSIALADLRPLLDLPDCEFVSLQYGDPAAEVAAVNASLARPIRLFAPAEIADFEELAGLVQGLDLVVSVQTALVHLSGALGAPCLAMLTRTPEWRYAAQPATMPWYRSVRLVRQGDDGRWAPVIAAVATELAYRAGRGVLA